MRLVNADKLEPSETYIGGEFVRFVYMDDIDEMPTVKAIPIDWLKEYLKPFEEFCEKLSEDTRENSGAMWVVDIINTMLEVWEKENEID